MIHYPDQIKSTLKGRVDNLGMSVTAQHKKL